MRENLLPMARLGWRTAIVVSIAIVPACAHGAGTPAPPCAAAEAKQFDFWVGEWDAEWVGTDGKPGRGTNRIDKILDGCVIAESFEAPDPEQPFRGRSYSVWDPRAKLWRQTWVDNTGGYLDFSGGLAGERMVLARDAVLADGRRGQQRMIFYGIGRNRFDWDWETSTDNGASWQLKWRIRYARRGSAP